MRIYRLILLSLSALIVCASCVNDDKYIVPAPNVYPDVLYDNVEENLWNYLLPTMTVDSPDTKKDIIKCVEFWQFLTDKSKETRYRADVILENVGQNLSIGKYEFPQVRSSKLTLLQDFVKFIDENRIIRQVSTDNLMYRTINLEDFKLLHPKLQAECKKRLNVKNFIAELMEGAQIVILCEKEKPIENILVLMIKPQNLEENRTSAKLLRLPELKIYYTILSISSYPYTEIK